MRERTLPAVQSAYRWIHGFLGKRFTVDTRSLAAFRVFVGLLVVADLVLRSRNFSFYYTDDGVVTEELARWWTNDAFSFFYLTSDPTLIALLFVIHGLVALQLIVGYKTRIATVLTFLFVISLDHHNPLVLSYADTLFRMILFWAIFLPLGERWSVDAVHRDRTPRISFVGLASVFALGQMIFMYTLNGLHKYPSELWQTGEGTPLVFGIDEMTFLLGDTMRNVPTLLEYGGMLWFHMLLASSLLLLLRGRWRLPLIAMFAGAHLSFAVTVRIGAFAYVALAGLILFVQSPFWEGGKTVLQRVGVEPARFVPARSRQRQIAGLFPNYRFDSERNRHRKEDIYNATVGALFVSILFIVAVIALSYGGIIHETVPDEDERIEYTIENTAGTAQIESFASYFSIDQAEWSIFAGPDPRTTDRYYVFAAKAADGEYYDVYFDRNLSYERPYQELQKQHDTYRMRFYMNSIRRASSINEAPDLLADHVCETWEEKRGITITHLNMYTIREEITRETIDRPQSRDRTIRLVHQFTCVDGATIEEFYPPPDS